MFPGKIIKEFPPSKTNARNSEGDFIRMPDGSIAFAYSRFNSGFEDGAASELAVSFSYDGGETFSPERVFLRPADCDGLNLMSVTLLPMQDGSVGVFYLKKFVGMQCKLFLRTTRDFVTFSPETCCFDEPGYYTVNNDRVRRLRNGDLIVPAGYTDTEGKVSEKNYYHDYTGFPWPPGKVTVHLSHDDGKSWERVALLEMPWKHLQVGNDRGFQEPGLVELDDGRIYMYYRGNTGRQLEAYSSDGGYTWTEAEPSRFQSPPSPMSTLKLCDGRIVVGYNPVPLYFGRSQGSAKSWTGGRNPFVLELADGNMNKIKEPRAIETDERSGFCYCSMLETDDAVLLGYCAGGEHDEGGCLTRLRIRKILKEDL